MIAEKGLLKAEEVGVGTRVLGLRSSIGSLAWSKVETVIDAEGEGIRLYGNRGEFTMFRDTVALVSGRGPLRLYDEVLTSNIYHSEHKVESAPLSNVSLEREWGAEQRRETSWVDKFDGKLLGFLARRLPLKNAMVLRLPKSRYNRLSRFFPPSLKPTLYSGDVWDWLRIDSPSLHDQTAKEWPSPYSIPQSLRRADLGKLKEFYNGLMLITAEEEEKGGIFHRTFDEERDLRGLICIFLAFGGADFTVEPSPLYSPGEIVIRVTGGPQTQNSIKASKFVGNVRGISLKTEHVDWFPLVNLSLVA